MENNKEKTALYDKRMDVGIRMAELHIEMLKANRELIRAGVSADELAKLNAAAFCW